MDSAPHTRVCKASRLRDRWGANRLLTFAREACQVSKQRQRIVKASSKGLSQGAGSDSKRPRDPPPTRHPPALLAPPSSLNTGERSMAKPVRICIWVPDNLLSEVDRVNNTLNNLYGLNIQRSDSYRIALQAFVRNVLETTEPYEIFSFTDVENAFSGVGRKKATPSDRSTEKGEPSPSTASPARPAGSEGEES